jgi:hypothetical protein
VNAREVCPQCGKDAEWYGLQLNRHATRANDAEQRAATLERERDDARAIGGLDAESLGIARADVGRVRAERDALVELLDDLVDAARAYHRAAGGHKIAAEAEAALVEALAKVKRHRQR